MLARKRSDELVTPRAFSLAAPATRKAGRCFKIGPTVEPDCEPVGAVRRDGIAARRENLRGMTPSRLGNILGAGGAGGHASMAQIWAAPPKFDSARTVR